MVGRDNYLKGAYPPCDPNNKQAKSNAYYSSSRIPFNRRFGIAGRYAVKRVDAGTKLSRTTAYRDKVDHTACMGGLHVHTA